MPEHVSNALLPSYDQNVVGIFPQGPGVVFAHWCLSDSDWEIIARMENFSIRLYRVVQNKENEPRYELVKEVNPPPYTASWYFYDLSPGVSYLFEAGSKMKNGEFFSLIRSIQVVTPPLPVYEAEPLPEKEPAGAAASDPPGPPDREDILVQVDMPEIKVSEVARTMPFYMGFVD